MSTVVIIGGGVAGVSCLESLTQNSEDEIPHFGKIVLISAKDVVKKTTKYELHGRYLESFDVVEDELSNLKVTSSRIEVKYIFGLVDHVDVLRKKICYLPGNSNIISEFSYDYLCICTGSRPRTLNYSCPEGETSPQQRLINERIIVIRDTQTVEQLKTKLAGCKRLVILGNGGISLELVYKISNCEKIWIVRDKSIGSVFFDSGAAKFLLDSLIADNKQKCTSQAFETKFSSVSYNLSTKSDENYGSALGPNWSSDLELAGEALSTDSPLNIIYEDEVSELSYAAGKIYPIQITTRQGKHIECDIIISAIGVEPNLPNIRGANFKTSPIDGGILIDEQMRTSIEGVYAAGDVVSCDEWTKNELWFQMRLWTQARRMGHYAAKCILSHKTGQDPQIYFDFDCFTHCTSFFGHKLTLLGQFNGQNQDEKDSGECQIMARVNTGKDYVKLVIYEGKIVGAVLVGDSQLEETIENLIIDRIDVSDFRESLLDNTIDIEDYFD